MGIKFDSIAPAAAAPAPAAVMGEATAVQTPTGFTLDLSKGSVLDLDKQAPGLKLVTLGAGWKPSTEGASIDLDISAFMLNENGKVTGADDIIYFRHMQADGIKLNGDDRTGGNSVDGDDETIDIELDKIPAKYSEIAVVVNIFEGKAKKQTFGMVKDSYVRLMNKETGSEICRYRLKDEASSSTAVIFCKLVRKSGTWNFETVGEGKVVDDLNGIAAMYM